MNDKPEPEAAAPAQAAAARHQAGAAGWLLRALRVLAMLGGLVVATALAVAVLAGVALAVAYPQLPDLGGLTDYRPKLPLRVLSSDGVLLGEFGEEHRTFVPIAQVPQVMKDAVLAIEDARFYRHGGVDYIGVLRAGAAQFQKAKSQGASTITMQVARNFYLSTEKTFTRKIYEILLALKIERQLGKDQILELYMNQIFLGQRAYGFAAAAEIYFGKPLARLSVAEAAMLAGLPQAPSAYNPVSNPARAKRRQQYIIDRMLANGFIDEAQATAARAEVLQLRQASNSDAHAEYLAETVRLLIQDQYGSDTNTRGLNVHVTVNAADQAAAYRALRRGILDYELRQVYRGPEDVIDLPDDAAAADARIAEALAERGDNDELKAAVVLEASPRKVVAALQSGETITVTGSGLVPVTSGLAATADAKKRIRRGAIVRATEDGKGGWSLTQLPEVQGAFVAMDPRTGEVRALVGGFDFALNKFNHVTQAWRQPGSSFKPFIYSAALERGITAQTMVNDAPLFYDAGTTGSQPWEPKNYDGKFDGPMVLKTALAKSKNMVSIRVLERTGLEFTQQWLTRFGFEASKHPAYLTMALGAGSVSPMQLAVGYSVFASGGYRSNPVLITRITDNFGRLLLDASARDADERVRVIDARNAYSMTQLMGEVTRSGTAARVYATFKRPDLYGKTGTTNDSMDAWFAGYHPHLAAVVWIGYDNPRKLGDRETGGGLALPVWMEYMRHALPKLPLVTPTLPEGLVQRGDDWLYDEYADGQGVTALGLNDKLPLPATEAEKGSILDLFRR